MEGIKLASCPPHEELKCSSRTQIIYIDAKRIKCTKFSPEAAAIRAGTILKIHVNLEPTDAESSVTNTRMQSNPAKIRRSNYHIRSQDDAIERISPIYELYVIALNQTSETNAPIHVRHREYGALRRNQKTVTPSTLKPR